MASTENAIKGVGDEGAARRLQKNRHRHNARMQPLPNNYRKPRGSAHWRAGIETIIDSQDLFGVGLIIAPTFPFLVMHGTSMVDAMGTSLASRVDVGDELLEVDGSPVHEVYPVSAYDHARAIACLCLHKVC